MAKKSAQLDPKDDPQSGFMERHSATGTVEAVFEPDKHRDEVQQKLMHFEGGN